MSETNEKNAGMRPVVLSFDPYSNDCLFIDGTDLMIAEPAGIEPEDIENNALAYAAHCTQAVPAMAEALEDLIAASSWELDPNAAINIEINDARAALAAYHAPLEESK